MSIFTQDCPNCGTTNSASADSCSCGYIFQASTDSLGAVEIVSQEEEAYEAYLSARLDQARIAAEKAIALLSQDPMDQSRVVAADQANRELEAINSEYESQLANLGAAQAEAERAKAEARLVQARLESEARQRQQKLDQELKKARDLEEKRANILARRGKPETNEVRPLSPPKIVSLGSPAVSAALESGKAGLKPSVAQPRALSRARSGRVRQEANDAIRARRVAQQLIAQKAEALASKRAGGSSMSSKLAEQTRDRAEQVVQQARQSMSNISSNLASVIESLDARSAPTDQANRASTTVGQNLTECPNCTAQISTGAKRCGCGYQFSTGAEAMPGLSLDPKSLQDLY